MVPFNFKVLAKFGLCSNCSQKLHGCSLARARKNFATARILLRTIWQVLVLAKINTLLACSQMLAKTIRYPYYRHSYYPSNDHSIMYLLFLTGISVRLKRVLLIDNLQQQRKLEYSGLNIRHDKHKSTKYNNWLLSCLFYKSAVQETIILIPFLYNRPVTLSKLTNEPL